MMSLRTLRFRGNVRSSDLLGASLPPNLATFECEHLELNVVSAENLAILRQTLRSCDTLNWLDKQVYPAYDAFDWTETRIHMFLEEFRIWQEEVPGFKGKIPWSVEARIEELGI